MSGRCYNCGDVGIDMRCSGCCVLEAIAYAQKQMAEDASSLAAKDAEIARLREALEKAKRFPNGWPQPTFLSVDEDDGSVSIEWVLRERSLVFVWDPKEGAMVCLTSRDDQTADETETAGTTLAHWLRDSIASPLSPKPDECAAWCNDADAFLGAQFPTKKTESRVEAFDAWAAKVRACPRCGGETTITADRPHFRYCRTCGEAPIADTKPEGEK